MDEAEAAAEDALQFAELTELRHEPDGLWRNAVNPIGRYAR